MGVSITFLSFFSFFFPFMLCTNFSHIVKFIFCFWLRYRMFLNNVKRLKITRADRCQQLEQLFFTVYSPFLFVYAILSSSGSHIDTLKYSMEYMPEITDMYSLFSQKLYISTLLSHPQKVVYDINIYVLLKYNISFSLLGGM